MTKKTSTIPATAVNIRIKDSAYQKPDDFCPLRDPGAYLPSNGEQIDALSLFELFFDSRIMEHILHCTYAYAESKKPSNKGR